MDKIEEIGVKKAKEKISTAKILLYLYDEFDSTAEEVISFIKEIYREDLKVILLHNKIDKFVDREEPNLNSFDAQLKTELVPHYTDTIMGISARDNINIELLKAELANYVEELKTEENAVVITNQRHYEALQKSFNSVQKVEEAVSMGIQTELLAYELRTALEHLGEISGEFTNDEVLGNIFSKFCIGK